MWKIINEFLKPLHSRLLNFNLVSLEKKKTFFFFQIFLFKKLKRILKICGIAVCPFLWGLQKYNIKFPRLRTLGQGIICTLKKNEEQANKKLDICSSLLVSFIYESVQYHRNYCHSSFKCTLSRKGMITSLWVIETNKQMTHEKGQIQIQENMTVI